MRESAREIPVTAATENMGNKAMADFMEGIGHRFIL